MTASAFLSRSIGFTAALSVLPAFLSLEAGAAEASVTTRILGSGISREEREATVLAGATGGATDDLDVGAIADFDTGEAAGLAADGAGLDAGATAGLTGVIAERELGAAERETVALGAAGVALLVAEAGADLGLVGAAVDFAAGAGRVGAAVGLTFGFLLSVKVIPLDRIIVSQTIIP